MKKECPRAWEQEAVREGRLSAGDAEAYERHERTCAECHARAAEAARVRELCQALAVDSPDDIRVRRIRSSILRSAARGAPALPARRVRVGTVVSAVALVAAVTVWMLPSRAPTPSVAPGGPGERALAAEAATVSPGPGALWSRGRDGATERVRLQEGSITLEVRHQEGGERFLVDLPDGELEVRGTRFEVEVRGRLTERVRVIAGSVALRRRGEAELVLDAGQSWERPREARPSDSDTPANAAAARSATAMPAYSPSSDVGDYAAAMALYRAGHFDPAARAFRAFASAHPNEPEAEDASFLEVASLAQAGRGDAAAVVAERFLEHHPRSFHARDAAIVVARAARERGDCAAARQVLTPWLGAPTSQVTGALGRCGTEPAR